MGYFPIDQPTPFTICQACSIIWMEKAIARHRELKGLPKILLAAGINLDDRAVHIVHVEDPDAGVFVYPLADLGFTECAGPEA